MMLWSKQKLVFAFYSSFLRKMDNIATTHWIINTEVFLWEIQNGEFHFSIFIDKFPNGLF